jgi:hypothetical protein
LSHWCSCTSRTAVHAQKAIRASGAIRYVVADVVRSRTFGVRLNALFSPVSSCRIEAKLPERLTGNRIRLKP